MLTSITLENYRSFGESQVIPLHPISVCVGPNNSGKSSLLSLGKFAANTRSGFDEAVRAMGGMRSFGHRPNASGRIRFGWSTSAGAYECVVGSEREEHVIRQGATPLKTLRKNGYSVATDGSVEIGLGGRVDEVALLWALGFIPPLTEHVAIAAPMVNSRTVKLAVDALRAPAPPTNDPIPSEDGAGLAATVALWRSAYPERAAELEAFVSECVPEIQHVLARPVDGADHGIVIRQRDGQEFGASDVSDGVLHFIALAMHLVDAPPGSVVFMEEPEASVHPHRIHQLVDLLRKARRVRSCQFVIATHSPVLVNEFRDEPEAILLFRRGEQGTKVTPLSAVPSLLEALTEADPGTMLANGFFENSLP